MLWGLRMWFVLGRKIKKKKMVVEEERKKDKRG